MFRIVMTLWEKIFFKTKQKKASSLNQTPSSKQLKFTTSFKLIFLLMTLTLMLTFYLQQYYFHKRIIQGKPHSIQFMGTLISENKVIALVDKRPMQVGDELYGMKIVDIQENKMDLKGANGLITLNVGGKYQV